MSKRLKNIGLVSALTVVSRVLGLVRDQLAAILLGTSVLNSAFITAFNLPNLFRRLLGEGALTAAFVPTLQDAQRRGGDQEAFRLLNRVVSWLALICGLLVASGVVAFLNSRRIAGQEEKWYLAADLSAYLFPYLFFVCVAAAFSAALQVRQRFLEPALSPIWLNLCMIGSLGGVGWHWAETDLARVHWLCAGVLVGGFLQMVVPAWALIKEGWRPRWDLTLDDGVREIGRLMAPGLWGTAIYQINIFVSRLLAYSIDDASATLLFLANRLMELPIGVFAIAVSTVVYPLLAKHAAERNPEALAEDYQKGLRLILLINVPAGVGLAVLAEPIIRLLFQYGRFMAGDTTAMAQLLAAFALAMPFFSVVSLTTRAFYAIKDTKTPVKVSTVSFVLNIGLSFALKDSLGALGLVIASTAAVMVQTLWLQRALSRQVPSLHFSPLWRPVRQVVLGAGILALVLIAVQAGRAQLGWAVPSSRWLEAVWLGGEILAGVSLYFAVMSRFGFAELEELRALVRRKLKRAEAR